MKMLDEKHSHFSIELYPLDQLDRLFSNWFFSWSGPLRDDDALSRAHIGFLSWQGRLVLIESVHLFSHTDHTLFPTLCRKGFVCYLMSGLLFLYNLRKNVPALLDGSASETESVLSSWKNNFDSSHRRACVILPAHGSRRDESDCCKIDCGIFGHDLVRMTGFASWQRQRQGRSVEMSTT